MYLIGSLDECFSSAIAGEKYEHSIWMRTGNSIVCTYDILIEVGADFLLARSLIPMANHVFILPPRAPLQKQTPGAFELGINMSHLNNSMILLIATVVRSVQPSY